MAQLHEMTVRDLLAALAEVEDEVRKVRSRAPVDAVAEDDPAFGQAARKMVDLLTRERQLIAELRRRPPEGPGPDGPWEPES